MGNRLKKAVQALLLILLITVACLAFMPWQMNTVIAEIGDVQKCMILRYDHGQYASAYPKDGQLQQLVDTVSGTTGYFDRNREKFSYDPDQPLYRLYLWNHEGRIPDIMICGTEFFYESSEYVLDDKDAQRLNAVLAECFS